MSSAPPLDRSPLWSSLDAPRRVELSRRCAALLQLAAGPAPWPAAHEAIVDLAALAAATDGLDLATIPGVPPRAVRARQLAFLGGRLCAEAALASQGLRLDAPLARGDDGAPAWPAGFTGSITHAAGVAMAVAMARNGPHDIGLDTESLIVQDTTRRAVLSQCLDAAERAALGPEPAAARLTAIFSAKEAWYKASRRAVGRMVGFREMTVAFLGDGDEHFALHPVAGAASGLPVGQGTATWEGSRVVTRVVIDATSDAVS